MAHTISGNLGITGSGATVFFTEQTTGFNNQQGVPAIADVSGNYISSALPDNTIYKVIPVKFGAEFSPFSQTVNLVSSDITGVDWSGISSYYHLVQGAFDSYNRGGITQNPISGWTTFTAVPTGDLQSVNNALEATTLSGDVGNPSGGYKTGFTPSADCYAQIQMLANDQQALADIKLRVNGAGNTTGFHVEFFGSTGVPNTGAFQLIDILVVGTLFDSPGFADAQSPIYTFNSGDTVTILIRGANFYAFLNDVPVAAASSTNTPGAGFTGLELEPFQSLSEIQFINWSAGDIIEGAISSLNTSTISTVQWLNKNIAWLSQN